MRTALFAVMVLLGVSSPVFGEEPVVWTYSESWWENVTPDQGNNCVVQESEDGKEPFVSCTNARFRLTMRQTAELNPAANAHGLELTVQIKDLSNNQIVSQETISDFYADPGTIYTAQTSYEVDVTTDGTGMGPFEGVMNTETQCSGGSHPPDTTTIGGHGFAFLWYRFIIVQTLSGPTYPGRAWYTHRPHTSGCPSICRTPRSALLITIGLPDQFSVVTVPIAFWHCSWFGGGAESSVEGMCWDFIYVAVP